MELNGILPIYKEKGYTSHDVVAKLRRILRMKRIGHTGTLDPSVTGVLPICLGKGTRVAEYLLDLPKTYEGEMTLGIATDTEDADGEVIARTEVNPLLPEAVKAAFSAFEGEISQLPPMYSAVKVDGKRLYDLARQGKEVERKPRNVTIYALEILGMEMDKRYPSVKFRVTCSKGTYIRTLCVDIGQKLGYPAHMSKLVRTKSGPFSLDEALTLDQVAEAVEAGTIDSHLRDTKVGVQHLPVIKVSGQTAERVLFGQPLPADAQVADHEDGTLFALYNESEELLAIHQFNAAKSVTKPTKVFS